MKSSSPIWYCPIARQPTIDHHLTLHWIVIFFFFLFFSFFEFFRNFSFLFLLWGATWRLCLHELIADEEARVFDALWLVGANLGQPISDEKGAKWLETRTWLVVCFSLITLESFFLSNFDKFYHSQLKMNKTHNLWLRQTFNTPILTGKLLKDKSSITTVCTISHC